MGKFQSALGRYRPVQVEFLSFITWPGNKNWLDFKQTLAATVKKNVPSKLSKGGARRPPWLNASVSHHIRKQDNLAKKAKRSGKENRAKYQKARNKATALVATAPEKCN